MEDKEKIKYIFLGDNENTYFWLVIKNGFETSKINLIFFKFFLNLGFRLNFIKKN